jgi:hypothetical protein
MMLVVNLKADKALSLTVPASLLAQADAVMNKVRPTSVLGHL